MQARFHFRVLSPTSRGWFALLRPFVLLLCAVSVAHAEPDKTERLTPRVLWVLAHGKAGSINALSIKLLGFGDGSQALPVIQKGIKTPDESIHGFYVGQKWDTNDVVFMVKNAKYVIAWRVTRAAEIVVTTQVDSGGGARVVPSADYAELFRQELKLWEESIEIDKTQKN